MSYPEKNRIDSRAFILTGTVHGGKTTLVEAVIHGLRKHDCHVAGLISRGIDRDGKRIGYLLVNIQTSEECILASLDQVKGWVPFRRFYFDPKAIVQGCTWLEQGLREGADFLVIDEVGPMELQGGGWSPVLEKLVGVEPPIPQLWVTREQILSEVQEKWGLTAARIMHCEQWTSDSLIGQLLPKIKDHE